MYPLRCEPDSCCDSGLSGPLLGRLKLTAEKISTLASGIRSIAAQTEPLDKVLSATLVAEGLKLEKVAVPIGIRGEEGEKVHEYIVF